VKLCITGALGHIGSALIRSLRLPDLEKLHIVDNMLTQRYPSLFDLPGGFDIAFHEIDILSSEMGPIICDSDVLVHLAAITDAERSFGREEEVEEVNKKGLEHVARMCAQKGCSLLFPSSTSVYGSQSQVVDETCPEEDLRPQSPYADSKIFGERLLARLSGQSGLRYSVFRIGTIFGYSIGMRFHTAVNKFVWQASVGRPLTVWKTALHQKRPYCGLEDCVRAINFFVANRCFDNEIYNIVTVNLSVHEVIETIKTHIPGVAVVFVDSPIMNQLSYDVSNQKSLSLGITYQDTIEDSMLLILRKLKNVNTAVARVAL